jgi:hypothetical protein
MSVTQLSRFIHSQRGGPAKQTHESLLRRDLGYFFGVKTQKLGLLVFWDYLHDPWGRSCKANPKIPPASGFGLFFWRENSKAGAFGFHAKKITPKKLRLFWGLLCGGRGIRTPGPVTVNGFQDRRIRPLCHPSLTGRKNTMKFDSCKAFLPSIRKNMRMEIIHFFTVY